MSEDNKPKEEVVWTEELLRERRKRATIMAIALLAFMRCSFGSRWLNWARMSPIVRFREISEIA